MKEHSESKVLQIVATCIGVPIHVAAICGTLPIEKRLGTSVLDPENRDEFLCDLGLPIC